MCIRVGACVCMCVYVFGVRVCMYMYVLFEAFLFLDLEVGYWEKIVLFEFGFVVFVGEVGSAVFWVWGFRFYLCRGVYM